MADRATVADPATGALSYSAGRSRFISFGTVGMEVTGPSSRGETGRLLQLGAMSEIKRFPETPYHVDDVADRLPALYRAEPPGLRGHADAALGRVALATAKNTFA